MAYKGIKITYNEEGITELHSKIIQTSEKAADALIGDLKNSQTIPFDVGTLQLNTYFENVNDNIMIISNTPYARRLYFHPEYNFRTTNNVNAGAKWFEPYLTGDKKDFFTNTFKEMWGKN